MRSSTWMPGLAPATLRENQNHSPEGAHRLLDTPTVHCTQDLGCATMLVRRTKSLNSCACVFGEVSHTWFTPPSRSMGGRAGRTAAWPNRLGTAKPQLHSDIRLAMERNICVRRKTNIIGLAKETRAMGAKSNEKPFGSPKSRQARPQWAAPVCPILRVF